MDAPEFEIAAINLDSHALNDHGRTVAVISPQGYVDWLLRTPDEDGPLLSSIKIEPHLSYVMGLKFNLYLPELTETMAGTSFEILAGGEQALISAVSKSADGEFEGRHQALIAVSEDTGCYEWSLETTLVCKAKKPVELRWIEYNNVYPHGTGRCMLFAPQKTYDRTLMQDRDGVVWIFPHQHCLPYTAKISELHFAPGALAGFFGEEFNPVVIVDESSLEPDWAICDMYYDLHCGARPAGPLEPGTTHAWKYRIKYLDQAESRPYLTGAKYVPIAAADYASHQWPRLALGRNALNEAITIDDCEEASGFPTDPPLKVWDRETGPEPKGSLRITNETATETVWSARPPTQIPASTKFRLVGLVKTQDVEGKGLFLRARYHTFEWRPEPHIEWVKTLESPTVTGTTDDWVQVATPELTVPKEHFDYLVWIDVVLDGKGVGWLTDVDVNLQSVDETVPVSPTPTKTPVLG